MEMQIQSVITWTPCDARLPDDDLVVLIAIESDSDPIWLGYYDSAIVAWRTPDGSQLSDRVTRWAELPDLKPDPDNQCPHCKQPLPLVKAPDGTCSTCADECVELWKDRADGEISMCEDCLNHFS